LRAYHPFFYILFATGASKAAFSSITIKNTTLLFFASHRIPSLYLVETPYMLSTSPGVDYQKTLDTRTFAWKATIRFSLLVTLHIAMREPKPFFRFSLLAVSEHRAKAAFAGS
jgi:hypothetical protein